MSNGHEAGDGVRFVRVPGGPRLEYVERGDRSGTPVLLLHGYSDSWRSFAMVLPHLPPSIRAIAISQRGHGDSERPATGYGMGDFAADASGVLAALGVRSAVVVGHSMGARVAERLADDDPDRVAAVVLAAAFAPGEPDDGVRELAAAVASLTDPVDPAFVTDFQAGTVAGPLPDGLLETAVSESLKLPAFVWRAALDGFVEAGRRPPRPAQIPTVVVWGDQDTFTTRADQDVLVRARRDSRLITYEGVGHALHWECPERFAQDLTTFVARTVARG